MTDPPHRRHVHDHDDGRFHGDFDQKAKTWDDDPAKVERARVIAGRVAQSVAPGAETRVLEYGAGTGLVSQALAPAGPLTLADPSAGMRAVMAAKVEAGTLPASAAIVDLDLGVEPRPADRWDLALAVQVLHHVDDLAPLLAGFAEVIAPGGTLCVVDLEQEDGSFHGEGFVGHHGFDRDELADRLRAAGFTHVAFEHVYDLERHGRTFPLFLATARR